MINPINSAVRFFIYFYDEKTHQPDIKEVEEAEFLELEWPISYERHSIHENGCAQICLTKMPIE